MAIQETDIAEDLMVDGDVWICKELLLSGRHYSGFTQVREKNNFSGSGKSQ